MDETKAKIFLRYFNTMYDRAISDVVIVGAGSAGLSCAWQLATTRPEVCVFATLYQYCSHCQTS
jgi:ribulose 1,5-bisphosphate synthetase/thiazole synthase